MELQRCFSDCCCCVVAVFARSVADGVAEMLQSCFSNCCCVVAVIARSVADGVAEVAASVHFVH